jgi:hypothetical protein
MVRVMRCKNTDTRLDGSWRNQDFFPFQMYVWAQQTRKNTYLFALPGLREVGAHGAGDAILPGAV